MSCFKTLITILIYANSSIGIKILILTIKFKLPESQLKTNMVTQVSNLMRNMRS